MMSYRCASLIVLSLLTACGNSDGSGSNGVGGAIGTGASSNSSGGQGAGATNSSGGGATGTPGGGATSTPGGGQSTGGAPAQDPNSDCVKRGGVQSKLPGTGKSYCLKAHPDCSAAGGACPLYVTLNMGQAYFEFVDDPALPYGKIMVAQLDHYCDCGDLKDSQAELPRVIRQSFPGHDPNRVYAIGWSAGAGGIARGQCIGAKFMWDKSQYGKTSDTYAAVALIGGYPGCAPDFMPAAPNYHVITVSGMNDIYGGSNNGDKSAEEALRRLAVVNGCSRTTGTWCSVQSGDKYVPRADGSDKVQKITFGECTGGDVVGYRFKDEAHTTSFKTHFDPKVSGFMLAMEYVSGRTKDGTGTRGNGGDCPN